MQKYIKQAEDMYNPQYNEQVNRLKASLDRKLSAYEQSKTGINQTYDDQVSDQKELTNTTKENFSNQMLQRGLQRSSIAVGGLTDIDNTNNKLVNRLNQSRANALGQVDMEKGFAQAENESTLAQLASDKQANVNNLAMQLDDKYWNRDMQEKEFNANQSWKAKDYAMQEKQFNASQSWKQKEYALAQQETSSKAYEKQKQVDLDNYVKKLEYEIAPPVSDKTPYKTESQRELYVFVTSKDVTDDEKMSQLSSIANNPDNPLDLRNYAKAHLNSFLMWEKVPKGSKTSGNWTSAELEEKTRKYAEKLNSLN